MLKIAVVGTSLKNGREPFAPEVLAKTGEVGEILAKKGVMLLSGGGSGLPWEATKAYKLSGGAKSVGYVAATDAGDLAKRFSDVDHSIFDEIVYLSKSCVKYSLPHDFLMRQIRFIEEADGILALQGGSGTLTEIGFAIQYQKPLGILTGLGGVGDAVGGVLKTMLFDDLERLSKVIFDGDANSLIERVIAKISN